MAGRPRRCTDLPSDQVLLPPLAMARGDRLAIAAGTAGPVLMERAGAAVTRAITARWPPRPVLVACGPGNNGGDGFVIARRLTQAGWPVRLALLGDAARLKGDAAWAAGGWRGPVLPLAQARPDGGELVVDALFGAGLDRPLAGDALGFVRALAGHDGPVVAVDVPSGVDGATGAVLGAAADAALTVTFCRAKPGHFLFPAAGHVGELLVAGIGIGDGIVAAVDQGIRVNGPSLWRGAIPVRDATAHKYRFGHAMVIGGGAMSSGAARLAAHAALRVGAGLVSVMCAPESAPLYAEGMPTLMTKAFSSPQDLTDRLGDERLNAWLIGPGAGLTDETLASVLQLAASGRAVVMDADALTMLARSGHPLAQVLHGRCVLTPHEGEFQRLFPGTGDRLSRARAAAAASGATIVLKGADTIVAAPDGRAVIADRAPASLAAAGTGDVLAGIILGLLAQGMDGHAAASAAIWLHARAAEACGDRLIAQDIPPRLPAVLSELSPGPAHAVA